jgi:putative addiction module component (TIGR02574 family)
MLTEDDIEKMTVQEKHQLIEMIWTGVADSEAIKPMSDGIFEMLEARMKRYREGKTTSISLEELEKQLEDLFP